jgi:hypothetical protein
MIKRLKNYVHEESDDESQSMESEQPQEELKINKINQDKAEDYSNLDENEELEVLSEITNQNQEIEPKAKDKKNKKKEAEIVYA